MSSQAPRPEVLAFLQAIKETPDDDTPRLVLADWLEERDDPRGRFLRLQTQLARLDEEDRKYGAMRREANSLAKRHV